jgi:hypothetical protein
LFVLLTTVSAGDGCCGGHATHYAPSHCDSCCGHVDCCTEKKQRRGLFARFGRKSCDDCCDPCYTAPSCGSCCEVVCCEEKKSRFSFGGLFRRKSKDCCDDCCHTPCCDSGCGSHVTYPAAHPAAPAPVQPGTPAEGIKKMPKPADEKKIEADKPKGALLMPQAPVTPTGARVEPELKNPF